MQLDNLKPTVDSKHAKRRVGHNIDSGLSKTVGRGHKGQRSCSGGLHKIGFKGDQMPLHCRLPKRGFTSLTKEFTVEVRLDNLAGLPIEEIDPLSLKQAGLVGEMVKSAKMILSGETGKKVTLKGISATAGAKAAIGAVGGSLA